MGGKKKDAAFRSFDFSNVREDPFNRIHSAILNNGRPSDIRSVEIPPGAFYSDSSQTKKTSGEIHPPPVPRKIHPLLAEWVANLPSAQREPIIINWVDTLPIPRFPEPIADEDRNSPGNQLILQQTAAMIAGLKAQRASDYDALALDLTNHYQATVLETFWLIKAMLVEMPLGSVTAVASRPDVTYVEPRYGGTKPPANKNLLDDVEDGRAQLMSDPFFNLGLSGGFIGLLDTGVKFTHSLFTAPSNIDFRGDCVNGGPTCDLSTNAGFDPTDNWEHGTSSAAIITGNANLGTEFRGVTGVKLDSFKVYETTKGLDTWAAGRAFQRAIALMDRVIVAEIQDTGGSEASTVCCAANKAYSGGAVIIATNGNDGAGVGTVNGPALAHNVLGVGAFNIVSRAQYVFQSRGPAPDGRIKPDVQAVTDAETAYADPFHPTSNNDLAKFGGTSGAAPFVAGAAVLLRNWLGGTSFSIDPGQVYAFLILSGQQPYRPLIPDGFDNTTGAGPLQLPAKGWGWWGKIKISYRGICDIPINIQRSPGALDGALWWPGSTSQVNSDVDLEIVDPTGTIRASSNSISSVFERARVIGPLQSGLWVFRIRGYNVTGVQTVYWAAFAH